MPMGFRPDVASRLGAAVLGGYALANLLSLALGGLLPLAPADTVTTALLLSFSVYAAAVLWAFAARSAWRAWAGLLIPAALAGLVFAVHGR